MFHGKCLVSRYPEMGWPKLLGLTQFLKRAILRDRQTDGGWITQIWADSLDPHPFGVVSKNRSAKNVSTRNRTCDYRVPACALTTILPRRSTWNMEVTSSTPRAVNFENLQKFIARSVMKIDIWCRRHFLQFRPRRIHKKYKKPDPNPLTRRKPRNSPKFVKILNFRHESLRYRCSW